MKLFILLVLILLFSITAWAQITVDTFLLKRERYTIFINEPNQPFDTISYQEYQYLNSNMVQESEYSRYYSTDTFSWGKRHFVDYNALRQPIKYETVSWGGSLTGWLPFSYETLTYHPSGKVHEVNSFNRDSLGVLYPTSTVEILYNANGQRIDSSIYTYSGGQKKLHAKVVYIFDGSGRTLGWTHQQKNSAGILRMAQKWEVTYQNNYQQKTEEHYIADIDFSPTLELYNRYITNYDANGNKILFTEYVKGHISPYTIIPVEKDSFSYDGSNNLLFHQHTPWEQSNNNWMPESGIIMIYAYDTLNRKFEEDKIDYNSGNNTWYTQTHTEWKYNAQNRIVYQQKTEYFIDTLNQPIWKTIHTDTTTFAPTPDGGVIEVWHRNAKLDFGNLESNRWDEDTYNEWYKMAKKEIYFDSPAGSGNRLLNTRFLYYYGTSAIDSSILDGISATPTSLNAVMYPNPTTSSVKVTHFAMEAGSITFYLYDLVGREVYQVSTFASVGENLWHINLPREIIATGIYIAEVSTSQGLSYVQKIVLE